MTLLLRDVHVFDGVGDALSDACTVRIEGNRIAEIAARPPRSSGDAVVIEGKGRTLIPGLIDCHYHCILSVPIPKLMTLPPTYVGIAAKHSLEASLMRGFTTVRDALGTDLGIVTAARDGLIRAPRIYPAGRGLSQTGGHGDMRSPIAAHPPCGFDGVRDHLNTIILADGVEEVRRGAREELRRGATQIKIMAGGGVASPTDPIHSLQYSAEEIRAAVDCAANWDTYVLAHAYTPGAIRRCLEEGVQSIEHANLIDDETAALAAAKDAVVVPNLVTYWAMDRSDEGPAYMKTKNREVWEAAGRSLELLHKHKVRVAYGTDLLGPAQALQSREFGLRRDVFSPAEILRQATSAGGELVARCGKLNPYGAVGVIREEAMADVLLVEGDPIADITLLEEPEKNLAVIVRDGEIVKNTT